MLIGSNTGFWSARRAIQSWSSQAYSLLVTFDAVWGGTSVANAIGSARSLTEPSAPCTRNLYSSPISKPGQNSSHTPVEPSTRSWASLPSQWLNSPIRLTPLAFGAQTAKDTPSTTPSGVVNRRGMGAQDLP